MASESSGDRQRNDVASRTLGAPENTAPGFDGNHSGTERTEPLGEPSQCAISGPNFDEWILKFEKRTYLSFLSRARASERLQLRGMLWMIALSVASATALCASVFSLATSPRPVSQTDLTAAIFSLVTLVLSLIVTSLNYPTRAQSLFRSFREIQRVSSHVESLRYRDAALDEKQRELKVLENAYQAALDQSENHTTLDYYRASPLRSGQFEKADKSRRNLATVRQALVTGIPVIIIIISIAWLIKILLDL